MAGSLSFLYSSITRKDICLNNQPVAPTTLSMFQANGVCGTDSQTSPFKYPAPLQAAQNAGVLGVDPYTPLLRAYQNDKVEVRIIVGSHLLTHDFSIDRKSTRLNSSHLGISYAVF